MGRTAGAGKFVAIAGGGAMTIAVQTSPKVAQSNLSAWLDLIGIDRVPPFLLRPQADHLATAIGVALVCVGLFWWWWDKRRKREPTIDDWLDALKDENARHTISSVDQRGGITAHTVSQEREDGR